MAMAHETVSAPITNQSIIIMISLLGHTFCPVKDHHKPGDEAERHVEAQNLVADAHLASMQ
jgi:hypothetical protein